MTKPLIIGQAPSACSNPDEPLTGRSGTRLAGLCGLEMADFLATFERTNLVTAFPGRARKGDSFVGRDEGRRLAERFRVVVPGRRVVVLGFTTAAMFGLTHPAFDFAPHWGASFAFCPHPSGVSTWWNDPENLKRATAFWSELARTSK